MVRKLLLTFVPPNVAKLIFAGFRRHRRPETPNPGALSRVSLAGDPSVLPRRLSRPHTPTSTRHATPSRGALSRASRAGNRSARPRHSSLPLVAFRLVTLSPGVP
jgi:hypothetical protein